MKQKICITIPSLHGAGCERVLSEVLPYYTSYYEVDLVLLENKIKYLIPENVNVIFLDKHIPENGFLKKIPVLISIIKLFIKHFQSNKYDVIISYLDTHNIIVLISKYLAGTKVPYVVVEQTTDYLFFENSRLSKLKQYLYKFGLSVAYNRVQHIIAVSENLKQFLVKELQIKTPITVIHNGFDSEKFNLNKLDDTSNINKDFLDTKNRILCIARLDYQKNIPFLIDSFALIKEKLPESNLFILGHGEQIDDIKKKITSMELSNRVFLLVSHRLGLQPRHFQNFHTLS